MDVSFSYFLDAMSASPVLLITVLLTLGVIFVNGWTDAPNAIATCVTTRCMNVRAAIIMSAVFNFLGVFVMTKINSSVASTISNMVDFGGNTHEALVALCAALFSIVVYSVGGLAVRHPHQREPQPYRGPLRRGHRHSKRHRRHQHGRMGQGALRACAQPCAGLRHRLGRVQAGRRWCAEAWTGEKPARFFRIAQIFGAAAMSFMHGAQDGQKFIGVLFLGLAFCNGQSSVERHQHPCVAHASVQRGNGPGHQRGR